MFTNRVLSSTLAAISATNATCETDTSTEHSVSWKYHNFVAPKLKPFMHANGDTRSHYNFLHDSLPYRSSNKQQLRLYDNYMNDVLSFNHIDRWKRITQCLHHDKHTPSKQLLCNALVTDYYIANEEIERAQSLIEGAYNSLPHKHRDLSQHDREELYVRAFYEWIVHFDEAEALRIFRFLSSEYPFDLYAAKRAQEMAFNLSDWDSMLSIFIDIQQYHSVDGMKNPLRSAVNGEPIPSAYYNGMLSFAYEQKGYLPLAEKLAMQGLQYYVDDNWLQHALVHSRYFQKNSRQDLQDLIAYVETHASKYWDVSEKHAFITTHNWWHLALLYLELDDLQSAMHIFRQHIWRKNLDRRADQIGALSMFWILSMVIDSKGEAKMGDVRLQKVKEEIGELWQTVMDYVMHTNKNVEVGYKLYDLLFMRGVIEMKRRYSENKKHAKYRQFEQWFQKRYTEMVEFCGDNVELKEKFVGLVDCMQMMYGEAQNVDHDAAYHRLSKIISDLNIIGGSREQRFVFDQMYIDLLIKQKQSKPLKEFLTQFLSKYPLRSLEIVATSKL